MRILLNKYYNSQNSAYTTVDKTVTSADPSISPFTTIINKDKGLTLDKLSFEFETLALDGTTGSSTGTTTGGGTTGGTTGMTSLQSFQANVYPISRQYCVNCHNNQFPEHASANVQLAHDRVVNEPLADFVTPANSRLVAKLKVNRHNCGSNANCDMIGNLFQAGITEWKKSRP